MHPSKVIYPQSEECPRYSRKSLELLKLQERARFSVPRTRPVVGRKRTHKAPGCSGCDYEAVFA